MRRAEFYLVFAFIFSVLSVPVVVSADYVKGGAAIASTAPVIKISREGHELHLLKAGDKLYVFNEKGNPITEIIIKDVYSKDIYSEPVPEKVARNIRQNKAILIFSNLPEYGDFIKAYLTGTAEIFREFIVRYSSSKLVPEARRVVDGIVYRPYKLKGTIEAFARFLKEHPDNYYSENARKRFDLLIYLPYKSLDKVSAYRAFTASYPENRYAGEARARIKELLTNFEEISVEHLAKAASKVVGKKVKFYCRFRSVLPIYVKGTSVGRKAESFASPRHSSEYLNLQVESGKYVLWRLFVNRDDTGLTRDLQLMARGKTLLVYGEVFSASGNAPWIDVLDAEIVR